MSRSLNMYLKNRFDLTLTPIQQEAVTALDGPTALISCPGSGKTTVSVIRLANLIVKGGADPKRVLALTFSKTAAKDMAKRFDELFPALKNQLRFLTIHSLAYAIIRHTGHPYQFLDTPDTPKKRQLLAGFYLEATGSYLADHECEYYESQISLLKNLLITPRDTAAIHKFIEEDPVVFAQIYGAYEAYKAEKSLLDYDDLLTVALDALQARHALKKHFQDTFTHIQVDEAQDVSLAQWELLQQLALPQNQLFLVGDDDQSIYGFRGADPGIFLKFKQIPGARIIKMNENFRSSQTIVHLSSTFIQTNQNRYPKEIITHNPPGPPPFFHFFQRESQQFEYLAKCLKALPPKKTAAVLYRHNISVAGLLTILDTYGLSYRLGEKGTGFHHHPIFKDVLAFFQLSADPYHAASFQRLAKVLYLPAITVRQVTAQHELPYLKFLASNVRFQKPFQKRKAAAFAANFPKLATLPPKGRCLTS